MSALSKINPWTSQPLTLAAKDPQFQKTLSLHAERVIFGRQAILTGWALTGIGIACLGASAYGWIQVISRPVPPPEFIEVDKIGGNISRPSSVKDAPKLFGQATNQHFIRQFVLAYEAWTPERDTDNDHTVRVMSSASEQTRLNEIRATPRWTKDRCKDCYITVENIHYSPGPVSNATQPPTLHYEVKFTRQVWHRSVTGAAADPAEPWTALIDFQWHPDAKIFDPDRDINLGGFVEVAYNSYSDLAEKQRHN